MLRTRQSVHADSEALARIDTVTWSPRVTPAPRRNPEEPFFGKRNDPGDVLVAKDDGDLLGYVSIHQPIPLPSHRHVLEVNGLAVDPRHQGRGVGRLLVEEAKNEARRRGARKLSLRVLAPNRSARRLYESCGFVVEGTLRAEFVLEGDDVDDVLMACQLEDEPTRRRPPDG